MNTTLDSKSTVRGFQFTPLVVASLALIIVAMILGTAWYVTAPRIAAARAVPVYVVSDPPPSEYSRYPTVSECATMPTKLEQARCLGTY